MTAISGKAETAGRVERRVRPVATPGYWRRHVHKESVRNTGSPKAGSAMTNRTPARDRSAAIVAERFVLPLRPGNSGGGKGPQFKTDATSSEGFGDWVTYQLRKLFRNCRRRCTRKRRQKPAIDSTRCTTRSAVMTSCHTPTHSVARTRAHRG